MLEDVAMEHSFAGNDRVCEIQSNRHTRIRRHVVPRRYFHRVSHQLVLDRDVDVVALENLEVDLVDVEDVNLRVSILNRPVFQCSNGHVDTRGVHRIVLFRRLANLRDEEGPRHGHIHHVHVHHFLIH